MKVNIWIAPPEAIICSLVSCESNVIIDILANFFEDLQSALRAETFKEYNTKNVVGYNKNIKRIKEILPKVKKFFRENIDNLLNILKSKFFLEIPEKVDLYVGYSFTIDNGLANDKDNSIIVLITPRTPYRDIFSILTHELFHLLFRLNKIEIPEEENFIRVFAPNGILTQKLGIDELIKEDRGIWNFLYKYDFKTDVWSFIKKRRPSLYKKIKFPKDFFQS